jgi:hypothetical protein
MKELSNVQEIIITEILEVEERLATIRNRIETLQEYGVGDSISRSIGKIYYLLGKYSELVKTKNNEQ